MHKIITDYGSFDCSSAAVKVYVRLRPPKKEPFRISSFLNANSGQRIEIKDPNPLKHTQIIYSFNKIFWTETPQEEMFDSIMKPQIDHVLGGSNACCFAYGQTGSGKTHTMFGPSFEDRGLIPRSAEYIFSTLSSTRNTVAVGVSFLEIYNDIIRDLAKNYMLAKENPEAVFSMENTSDLYENVERKRADKFMAPDSDAYRELQEELANMNYEIQDDGKGNVAVKDLTILNVSSPEEIMAIINFGMNLRATKGTKMNEVSSRSHSVFTIRIVQTLKESNMTVSGILNLVDLAGNEKVKQSESTDKRLREMKHINSSLTALGKVIMALDPTASKLHVPFRESKLTRILQNSLSGNSYTVVVANIHPHPDYYEECLSTLEFVNRCRNVSNHPKVNHSVNIDAVAGKWTLTSPRNEPTFGNFDQQPMYRLVSTSSKLFWRHRTSIELNLYEHSTGDLLELSAYNIDAKVDLDHVYLKKSPLIPAVNALIENQIEVEKEEAKSLGIKYYEKTEAQLTERREKLMMEYITNRTNLDRREGEDALYISVVPLNADLADDGSSPIVLGARPEGIAPITQLDRINATEKFDKVMLSFQANGVSKIQKEIAKALNFEDITKKAMGSAIIRLNSQRLEQQASMQEAEKELDSNAPAPILASPPPKKNLKPSAATTFVNENRILHAPAQGGNAHKAPADDLAVKVRVGAAAAPTGNRRHTEIAKRPAGGIQTKVPTPGKPAAPKAAAAAAPNAESGVTAVESSSDGVSKEETRLPTLTK